MDDCRPDRWVVVKVSAHNKILYKVFGAWSGDSWRMNSGIVSAELVSNYWEFTGWSGSVYRCHQDYYGVGLWAQGVLDRFINGLAERGHTMEIMPPKTSWDCVAYDPLQQFIEAGDE